MGVRRRSGPEGGPGSSVRVCARARRRCPTHPLAPRRAASTCTGAWRRPRRQQTPPRQRAAPWRAWPRCAGWRGQPWRQAGIEAAEGLRARRAWGEAAEERDCQPKKTYLFFFKKLAGCSACVFGVLVRPCARPPAPHGLLWDGAPGPAELLPGQQEERLHCRALHRRRVHCCLSARGARGERCHCAAAERPGARAGRSLSRPAAAPGAGARAGGAGGCRGRGGRACAGALPGGHCRAAGAAAGGGRRRLRALLVL